MSYTRRPFSRDQVASEDSKTDPLQVGFDGVVGITINSRYPGDYKRKGFGFTLDLNVASNEYTVPDPSQFAPIRNIGDPDTKLYKGPYHTGLMEMNLHTGCAYIFDKLPPNAWVRVAIYRLDKGVDLTVALRTSYGDNLPVAVQGTVPVSASGGPLAVNVVDAEEWVTVIGSK